jgi:hypothetical protein
MNDPNTLDIEISIRPAKGRRGGRSPSAESTGTVAPPISRLARLLALAIKFQDMVDQGHVRDYADIARLGYVTRARLTQIMNLSLLAPEIQDGILFGGNGSALQESRLRVVVAFPYWQDQLQAAGEQVFSPLQPRVKKPPRRSL